MRLIYGFCLIIFIFPFLLKSFISFGHLFTYALVSVGSIKYLRVSVHTVDGLYCCSRSCLKYREIATLDYIRLSLDCTAPP